MFIKSISYTDKVCKEDVELEAELQLLASTYFFAPKVYNTIYDVDCARIVMEKINGPTLEDKYGNEPEDMPEDCWDQIRDILETLYDEESIEYVDVAARNFIECEEKIYILDFEHAYFIDKEDDEYEMNWFVRDFLDGENSWNPDFE